MSGLRLRATGSLASASPQKIDEVEVRRALALLVDPESGCQIFTQPTSRKANHKGHDLDGMVESVKRQRDQTDIYVVLNPLPLGQEDYAKNGDILKRRWLFIDVDPIKPDDFKDFAATNAEHDRTRQAAEIVRDHLSAQDWPAPIFVDSGNGWYLLYRIDLPNDNHSTAIIKKLLKAIHELVKDKGKVDIRVSDARRIARVPGTYNCKGKTNDDRPWRPCKLVFVPKELEIVSGEMIAAVGGPEPQIIPLNGSLKRGLVLKAGSAAANRYVRRAMELECSAVASALPGDRNNRLNKAAYSLAGFLQPGYISRGEIEVRLYEAACSCGLREDPGCGERGIHATISSGIEAGKENIRYAEDRFAPAATAHLNGECSASDVVPSGDLIIVRASSITPRRVEWVWPGRIPLGKLTTFAGVGGLGKTFVLCDITARITLGAEWPHSGGECAEQGQVLFVSGEDDPDDTLVPRLIELGADLDRVVFLKTEVQDRFTLADLKTLDKALDQAGPDVRFVAIDPPTAYLGGVDDHKNAELRGLLSPLKSWAARRRVAIVFNTHVNKPQGAKVEAMMRVMGSVAWVNAVRAAHMFAKDPENHERRLFVGMKLNIGKEQKGLSYRIVSTGDLARVEWIGEVDTTADEAVNREKKKKRGLVAAEWLAELFQNEDELKSDVIWKAKDNTDLSRNAILEAKDNMGIKAKQVHDPEGGACWVWYWPRTARQAWSRPPAPAHEDFLSDEGPV